jgi:hypothetical protein
LNKFPLRNNQQKSTGVLQYLLVDFSNFPNDVKMWDGEIFIDLLQKKKLKLK